MPREVMVEIGCSVDDRLMIYRIEIGSSKDDRIMLSGCKDGLGFTREIS